MVSRDDGMVSRDDGIVSRDDGMVSRDDSVSGFIKSATPCGSPRGVVGFRKALDNGCSNISSSLHIIRVLAIVHK